MPFLFELLKDQLAVDEEEPPAHEVANRREAPRQTQSRRVVRGGASSVPDRRMGRVRKVMRALCWARRRVREAAASPIFSVSCANRFDARRSLAVVHARRATSSSATAKSVVHRNRRVRSTSSRPAEQAAMATEFDQHYAAAMNRQQRKRQSRARLRSETERREDWAQRTNARLFDAAEFRAFKSEGELYVVGVMGFAGSWQRATDTRDAAESARDAAKELMRRELTALKEQHGESLVIASGATNAGTLQVAYQLCGELGIRSMGIAPHGVLAYDIAAMDYVLPFGERFGDESAVFILVCDEFLVLGGGRQTRRETIDAHRRGKPVTVVQGFGGASAGFTAEELPNARFVSRN